MVTKHRFYLIPFLMVGMVAQTGNLCGMGYAQAAYSFLCGVVRWMPMIMTGIEAGVYSAWLRNPNLPIRQEIVTNARQTVLGSGGYIPLPEASEDFLQTIVQSRGIENVIFYQDNVQNHGAQNNETARIVFLAPADIKKLEEILKKQANERLPEEQEFLTHVRTMVHHELTHIKRRSDMRITNAQKVASLLSFGGIEVARRGAAWLLSRYIPSIASHPVGEFVGVTAYGLTGIAAIAAGYKLTELFYKPYDELMADEGIPNDKALLELAAKNFEKDHQKVEQAWARSIAQDGLQEGRRMFPFPQRLLAYTLGVERMDRYPSLCYGLMRLGVNEHPANIIRAKRFRKRIVQLDVSPQR